MSLTIGFPNESFSSDKNSTIIYIKSINLNSRGLGGYVNKSSTQNSIFSMHTFVNYPIFRIVLYLYSQFYELILSKFLFLAGVGEEILYACERWGWWSRSLYVSHTSFPLILLSAISCYYHFQENFIFMSLHTFWSGINLKSTYFVLVFCIVGGDFGFLYSQLFKTIKIENFDDNTHLSLSTIPFILSIKLYAF